MKKIDLREIIKAEGLNKKELARQLFPGNKYPSLSLNRIINGEALLDADQISKLSLITGRNISDLFDTGSWKTTKSKDSSPHLHIFENGSYKVEYDAASGATRLFHSNSLFHGTVITKPSITLDEFLNEINSIINNYQKNGKSRN